MKYRNGFVSNSSSTSFIVAMTKKSPCPCCGRGAEDILDIIEQAEGTDCDSRVYWRDPTEYLQELRNDIKHNEEEIEKCKNYSDEDLVPIYNCRYTAGDLRRWSNETMKNNIEMIKKVEAKIAEGKTVVSFAISYHNDLLKSLVDDQVRTGYLELIKDEAD